MLEKIKKMLGLSSIPEEVSEFYKTAKNEQEALLLLKEARRRDESRRRRAIEDLDILHAREQELLVQGKALETETAKMNVVREIKEIRWKMAEINTRIDRIYDKRIKVYNEHVQSMETILDLKQELLPQNEEMESAAVKAQEMLEDLDKKAELAEGIGDRDFVSQVDPEDAAILAELEAASDADLIVNEPKVSKDEPVAPEIVEDEEDEEDEGPKREVMYE